MTRIQTFSDDSFAAIKRDHERLRYEMQEMRAMLRAFMSAVPDRGKRLFCRFTLGAALATTDLSKSATITHQYGPGADHADTSITVYNLGHSGSGYVFSGASGAAGYAFWDAATKEWYILQMECP